MVLNYKTQETRNSDNGPKELNDYDSKSTLSDYTVSNRQSFNCDNTDDSSDGDDSIPPNFNEIGPIEMQRLNNKKSKDVLVPIKTILQ